MENEMLRLQKNLTKFERMNFLDFVIGQKGLETILGNGLVHLSDAEPKSLDGAKFISQSDGSFLLRAQSQCRSLGSYRKS